MEGAAPERAYSLRHRPIWAWIIIGVLTFMLVLGVVSFFVAKKSPQEDVVVGIKQATLFKDASLSGNSKETILTVGSKVRVLEVQGESVKVSTDDGKEGWMPRYHLCQASELKKRQADGHVPNTTIHIVSEKGRVFITSGTVTIGNDGQPAFEPGLAIWCDRSVEPNVGFNIDGNLLAYKPDTLCLITPEYKIVELAILAAPEQ
jgi:hypothetical protein